MKQTAVQWLADKMLTEHHSKIEWDKIVDQAKAMEKEQIRDAFNSGMNDSVDYFIPFLEPNDESENYYNKTFKSE